MSQQEAELSPRSDWARARSIVLPAVAIVVIGIVFVIIAVDRDDTEPLLYGAVAAEIEPAVVEAVGDTELNRVELTERAAERLDIQTVAVAEQEIDGELRLVIPYSAVLYGLNGETWAYISPERLTYVRDPISVDYIDGDVAFLTAGPPAGTEVVTVGVAELYGADTGVGK